jgi:serine/threonine protein kinase
MSAPELNLGPQYRVLTVLAKGGMGTVYLGEMRTDDGEHRAVAIKVMHHHIAESWETLSLFVDEARVGTRIHHPNVVRVLATEVVQETPFLVMEYIEGLSWSRLVRRAAKAQKTIPLSIAGRVVRDALIGLHAAHELRTPTGEDACVVHRDVSPQNILVGSDGVVRLTDFGVATFAGRITSTAPGELRGKLGYIAPEQMKKGAVDRRSDVFAAGIVLWEAITAQRLFGADTQAETLAKVLSEPIAPPSTHRHEVTLDLDDVCLRALERDKDRRFQTALDFANELEKVVEIASDEELVAFLNELAAGDLEKQRKAREEAQRGAGRWSAPNLVLGPPRTPVADAMDEPTIPAKPKAPKWPRWAAIAGAAIVLIVVGSLIGRMSSSKPPPAPVEATPTPMPMTPPPSATVIAASPEPVELPTTTAPAATVVRRPPTKPHRPAASASTHPPSKPAGKYVPGEL